MDSFKTKLPKKIPQHTPFIAVEEETGYILNNI